MKYAFWKYFLRYLGFIRFVHRTEVLGMPESRSERVYYLWRWGKKYRFVRQQFTPIIYGSREAPRNIRAAEICCDSTKRNSTPGANGVAAAKPDHSTKI